MSNDWRIAQVREVERELKKHPFIEFMYTDAKGETARQIKHIEDFISMNIDVLITSPRDAVAMNPVVSRAFKQGIPVVLISRSIITEDYTSFIHPDNKVIAKQAARFMANELKGKGRIFMLRHTPTTTPGIHRTKSFLKEIEKYKDMEIVAIRVADSLRAKAIQATEEVIMKGIKFDAIYAQSDSMAGGAILALKKAATDPKDILIVGIDYISEARDSIKSGEQNASFTYPTGGTEGARIALRILQGEEVPKEIVIDSTMVTKDNVEEVEPIF